MDFYRQFMPDDDARKFVRACEALQPPGNAAKLIMHQCRRLVLLAQEVGDAKPNRHSLQLLFLLICAEAVAKLADGRLTGSRKAVQTFFRDHVPSSEQDLVSQRFRESGTLSPLSLQQAVNVLYDVRCSVAHEGDYWGFNLGSGLDWTLTGYRHIESHLAVAELIRIIVEGSVIAARKCLASSPSGNL
jgi:hypothetical protein